MTFGRSLPGHAFPAAVLVVPIVQANHIGLLLVNFCKFPLFLISVKLPLALFSLKGICDHPLNHRQDWIGWRSLIAVKFDTFLLLDFLYDV
jgi:hypothetical protein